MTQEHPITPPEELVREWLDTWDKAKVKHITEYDFIATQAARWGADQQLEQCEKYWMTHGISPEGVVAMRYALRPKPPSLKEQALALISHDPKNQPFLSEKGIAIIRRALEALPD